jgi:small redox-active disulfide protein 2
MVVKVLGSGCAKCKALEQRIIALKTKHTLNIDIEKITRLDEIMAYGVMMTPGLVIDGKLKSMGKLPKDEEILKWILGA